MGAVHSPLGTGPIPRGPWTCPYIFIAMGIDRGTVPGSYPNGPYLGGLYPPVPIPIIAGSNVPTEIGRAHV